CVRWETAVQQERALSLLALGGDRQAAAGMQAQRSKTNTSLGELSVLAGVVHDLNPDAVAKSNAEFAELAARLPVVRQGVDQLLASPVDVDDFYSQLAEVVIVGLEGSTRTTPDPETAAE